MNNINKTRMYTLKREGPLLLSFFFFLFKLIKRISVRISLPRNCWEGGPRGPKYQIHDEQGTISSNDSLEKELLSLLITSVDKKPTRRRCPLSRSRKSIECDGLLLSQLTCRCLFFPCLIYNWQCTRLRAALRKKNTSLFFVI